MGRPSRGLVGASRASPLVRASWAERGGCQCPSSERTAEGPDATTCVRTVTRGNHMGASSRLQRVATHLHSRASAPCSARSTGAAASASGRSGEFGLLEISAPSGIESAGRNDPLSRYVCTFCSPAQVFPHKTDTRSTSLSLSSHQSTMVWVETTL